MANPEAPIRERITIQVEAIEKLEKQISDRISRILKFTNLYFVFQGIIFSSFVSSQPNINCKLKWIPFTLSLLVSIFNFLAVWENINTSLKLYKVTVNKLRELDKLREEELRGGNAAMRPQQRRRQTHSHKIPLRIAVSYLTLLLLFVFTGIMLCGCFKIECVNTAAVTKD